MRLAAIDLGSNAVRLLFKNVFTHNNVTHYQKESLIRVPIRLGKEAFVDGVISDAKKDRLLKTIESFTTLLDVYGAEGYMACATAAFREAENGEAIVQELQEKSGLTIDIINGRQEAKILHSLDLSHYLTPDQNCLYIDVGGGSTEISLFVENKFLDSQSFKIGTIRILHDLVQDSEWEAMKKWLTYLRKQYGELYVIGSGGNINKLIKMYGKKKKKRLNYDHITRAQEELATYKYEERINLLGLKPDRADVILPATEIFKKVMFWGGIKKVYVPTIGIADGLIKLQREQRKEEAGSRVKVED